MVEPGIPTDLPASYTAQMVWAVMEERRRVAALAERPVDPTCSVCHQVIVVEPRGGPHPSPGDHDPAYHVAAAYGTWHPSLDR